jgi:predicted lipid-binding transport protein (Tim44 family)
MNRMCPEPRLGGRTRRPVRPGVARGAAGVLLGAMVAGCGADTPVTATPPAPTVAITASPIPAAEAPTAAASATGASGAASVTPVASPAPGDGPAADRAAAETVFRTYLRAAADGDFATACSLNAPETNQRLLDELARRGTPAPTCEQAIAALYAGSGVAQGAATIANTLSIERVDVDGDAATVAWSVEVSGRRPVVTNALRRVDGQWRLLPTPDPAG